MILRLFGFLLFGGCLASLFIFESNSSAQGYERLFHWPAMVLTGVGPVGLILICFDSTVLGRTIRSLSGISINDRQGIHEEEAKTLHRLSQEFYTNGIEAFENCKITTGSDYFKKTIQKLSMRIPIRDIRDILVEERNRFESRFFQCCRVSSLGLRLSPSIGMLGTILGMVRLLSTLSDPAKIGAEMSLALLTTFYGLFFSLLLWTPVQQKIERLIDVEMEGYDQILRWLELLEQRKPTTYFAEAAEIPMEKTIKVKKAA